MRTHRFLAGALVLVLSTFVVAPAEATFHLWYIKEIYSNESGSVQFIELFTSSTAQDETNGEQISSASGSVFTFNANTGNPTSNKHLLLATASFTSLPGAVPPNFASIPLPPNFFNPAGDTLTFVGSSSSSRTFGLFPAGNVNSLNYSGPGNVVATIQANSPTNFAGNVGSINRGDYNDNGVVDAGDYVVWRKTFGQTVSSLGSGADGDSNGSVGNGDYAVWRSRFGNTIASGSGGSAMVPEPTIWGCGIVAWASLIAVCRRRQAAQQWFAVLVA